MSTRGVAARTAPLADGKLLSSFDASATPQSLHAELEFVIDWLRNGLPPASQLPPLPERRHERSLAGALSNLLAAPRGEPFLFVIEELHLGAPEL